MVVLMLEDCDIDESRELWHTRVKTRDNITDGGYKEKLEKMLEAHYVALKSSDITILTVTSASKNSERMELDIQKPGPGNKGTRRESLPLINCSYTAVSANASCFKS